MKQYCLKFKYVLAFALFMGAVFSISNTWIAIILKDVIDTAILGDKEMFYNQVIQTMLLLLLICGSYYLHSILSKRFIIQVIKSLRNDIFTSIIRKNNKDFTSVNTADYISSLSNDVKLVEENYFIPMFLCLNNILQFVASFIIMIVLSPTVTICLVISMTFMIIIPSLFQSTLQKRQNLYSKKLSEMTIQIKDFLSGYQVIRSYQMEDYVKDSFNSTNNDTMNVKYAWDKINASVEALSTFLGSLVQCGVLFLSAYLIITGELSAGSLVGLVQVSGMIAMPIQIISTNLPKIQGTKLVIAKLKEHITYQSTAFQGTQMPSFSNVLEIKQLAFSYDEITPVLQDINLLLEPHKKYAFIGKSGCGKTTLINLLTANYDQYQGEILYDGIELSKLDIKEVAKLSAVIHQGVYMFDSSIEHNISLHHQVTNEQLHKVLSISGVSSFLDDKKKLEAPVGENGCNLSGGQRQRIAVARALLQKKPILILDEGTSAIDKQTAYDIESKLIQLEHLTMITITHSLNAELLQKYDEVVFLEDGRIIEKDSFDNLLTKQGAFYKFYQIKTS